jgi:hypothetical protein
MRWAVHAMSDNVAPILTDGSTGPELSLRPIFQKFLLDISGADKR